MTSGLPRSTRPRARSRSLALLAGSAAVVLGLTGCTLLSPADPSNQSATGVETADPAAVGDVDEDLRSFYEQEVQWEDCEEDFSCATIDVPLDYSDPGRGDIEIAAIRADATSEAKGTILINPGGPGASGFNIVKDSLDYVTSERLREDYDV
ncbi:MAG: tripeptidyl-peptidase Serine peptidase family, partial [Micrococcaceae bacterium]|nr:tripeptidyl-peptidase Serine peptidase family [Micrococcaceae bacterium]